jgi:hypothetical protein
MKEYYTLELKGIILTKMKLIRDNQIRLINPSEPMTNEIEELVINYIKYLRESLIIIHQGMYDTKEYYLIDSKIKGIESQLEDFEPKRKCLRAYGSIRMGGRG